MSFANFNFEDDPDPLSGLDMLPNLMFPSPESSNTFSVSKDVDFVA